MTENLISISGVGKNFFFIFFEASKLILDPTQTPIQRVKGLFRQQ